MSDKDDSKQAKTDPRPELRRPKGRWGQRLSRIAERHEWTLMQLAEGLGVPYRTCQAWWLGARTPSASAQKLIEHLDPGGAPPRKRKRRKR